MWHTLLKPLALGLGLVTLALLALVGSGAPPTARAAGPTCTVCPAGGGCTYTTIQAAVDDEGCQEIKVAQGVYSGVQAHSVPVGYIAPPASGLITQVVYISRTVTVRGGYTTTNWTTPDPVAQPTTIDAEGQGRALVITGDISPTIEGLGLTNGDAAGLGGNPWVGGNSGGGAYVLSATTTIRNCQVFSNTTTNGGGLYLSYSPATLISNSVTANTAGLGGGLSLWHSDATLISNSITANTAGDGGGLYSYLSNATLSANSVASNKGGGLVLERSSTTLNANSVASNKGYGLFLLWGSNATLVSNSVASNGGGLHLLYSSATLISNSVTANTDANGGGLHLTNSSATLVSNSVTANTATDYGGGGLELDSSSATLISNSVTANTAAYGGGLDLINNSNATLISNSVASNTASYDGGGLDLYYGSSATLISNSVTANTASSGGGLALYGSSAILNANGVTSNTATTNGGGLYLYSSPATLFNTVVADNWAGAYGSGLYSYASGARLLHATIARNGGGDGSGLYVAAAGGPSTVWLTNTILVSQTIGITVAKGCTATLNGTLWRGNIANWGGAGTFAHSGDATGNPAFVDPGGGDYHIGPGSAAINQGTSVGVAVDKDGQPRDARPDLGAYEFQGLVIETYLPVIRKGAR